jgi:hypothetical protein
MRHGHVKETRGCHWNINCKMYIIDEKKGTQIAFQDYQSRAAGNICKEQNLTFYTFIADYGTSTTRVAL